MFGTRLEIHDFAMRMTEGMSDADKIGVMREIGLSITDGTCGAALLASADQVGRHAHHIAREQPQKRSDGSLITPYAPCGGPLEASS